MKFINPSVEIWEQDVTTPETLIEAMWAHIARCVRVCYQVDKPKCDETEEEYVKRVIFRNPDERLANHYSVLEHGSVYLKIPNNIDDRLVNRAIDILYDSPYTKHKYIDTNGDNAWFFSTNFRVLVEHDICNILKYAVPFNPKWHEPRVTVSFITNIGVTRETNRHRVHSPSEESTRYCNYAKEKFGEQLTYPIPAWLSAREILDAKNNPNINCALGIYLHALNVAEKSYNALIKYGWTPQQAREVLPLATKSQLVHTAFITDWWRFLKLRADGISGPVHPNMEVIAKELSDKLHCMFSNNA